MQQVIVYRNPAEAAFWDLMTNSPNMFPISVGIVMFFVAMIVSDRILRGSKYRAVRQFGNSYASLVIGTVIGFLTTWYMWL